MRSTRFYLGLALAPSAVIGLLFAAILVAHGKPGDRDWLGGAAVLSLVTGFGSAVLLPVAADQMRRDFHK
jgi:hypothetical protein